MKHTKHARPREFLTFSLVSHRLRGTFSIHGSATFFFAHDIVVGSKNFIYMYLYICVCVCTLRESSFSFVSHHYPTCAPVMTFITLHYKWFDWFQFMFYSLLLGFFVALSFASWSPVLLPFFSFIRVTLFMPRCCRVSSLIIRIYWQRYIKILNPITGTRHNVAHQTVINAALLTR